MRAIFLIFAVVGWIWTIVFLAYLWIRVHNRKREAAAKGFEVVQHEQRSP